MTTTVYLMRHGEVYNPDNIIYGRLSTFGLSEKGKKEIEKSAQFLRDKNIETIYASPLERTWQTATIIQENLTLPPIQKDDDLIEVKTSYEGSSFDDMDEWQSDVYLKPLDPTDETIVQLAQRMQHFLNRVVEEHRGKTIVAVSHGDPIMALKAVIKKRSLEFYSFKTDNYVQHGEIYEIIAADKNNLSIESVFEPHV